MLAKILASIFIVSLFVGLVACGDPTSVAAVAQNPSSSSNWQDYKSATGRFTVTIPGTFNEVVAPSKMGSGTVADVHSFNLATTDVTNGFTVNYFDLPAEYASAPSAKLLDSLRDGLATSLQIQQPNQGAVTSSKVTSEKQITLGSATGRELEMENGTSTYARAKIFLQGMRAYHVVAIMQAKDKVNATIQGYAQRFLDSFVIN